MAMTDRSVQLCLVQDEGGIKTSPQESFSSASEDFECCESSKFGTFNDSKSAPIHRWFQYPAGFSYKAVEYVLGLYGIDRSQIVYDPFAGTGTTCITCKFNGIESIGAEAHPFVVKVAQAKAKWDYNYSELNNFISDFICLIQKERINYKSMDINIVPELVRKCYSPDNLCKLLFIRSLIESHAPAEYKTLLEIALVGTLREASGAANGWPYIAPKKKIQEKDGINTFISQLNMCFRDLKSTPLAYRNTRCDIVEVDCRSTNFEDEIFDLVFTSPPYLNNYDYADRTRLETYFMGFANSWRDITSKVRDRLIVSATTQILRGKYNINDIICDEIKDANPNIAKELQEKVSALSKIRNQKGGKKSYDIMVGQYFNDLTLSLIETYRLMKNNSKYLLILGDSAPYGVHIPTETYLGKIGLGVGFKSFKVSELRKRGQKWSGNPQRHHVPLRESILILEK